MNGVGVLFILIEGQQIWIMQKMRQQQRYLSKLQKISETSSPSKQQQSPVQTNSFKSRINPASLTSSYLKFKRFEQQKQKKSFHLEESIKAQYETNLSHEKNGFQTITRTQTIEQKNQKISSLQEKIVRKKMQLNILEDCFENRSNPSKKDSFGQSFARLLTRTLRVCQKSHEGRKAYLSLVFKYSKERKNDPQKAFKFLVEWLLRVIRQLFSVLSSLLKSALWGNQ